MNKTYLLAILGAAALAGCASDGEDSREYTSLANPASVFCVQQGGELEMDTMNDRRMTYCVTENGEGEKERVEQWEYYRAHHENKEAE